MSIDLNATFGKELDPVFAEKLAQVFKAPIAASSAERLDFTDGSSVPVVNHMPRFVSSDHYTTSFSFQWTLYSNTQHNDELTHDLSVKDFTGKFGMTEEQVKGKLFLDAGCGSGRLLELLAQWGAYVIGADLSESVDVARHHVAKYNTVAVIQADIGNLPFRPECFDTVVSTGVLHHTPDTRAYAAKLVPLVKPGGEFGIWVYNDRIFARRKEWIPITSRIPHKAFNDWCVWITEAARANRGHPLLEMFIHHFPFTTYHETAARSALTVFDGYSPTYHGIHSEAEVMEWFREFGLVEIHTNAIPTSVRGRKPA